MKRFKRKLDYLTWFIIAFLPLFIYFVMTFNCGFNIPFTEFISSFSFTFVSDILGNLAGLDFNADLVAFISYMVSVELIHVLFDFLVFIPRLAHDFLGGFYAKD